MYAIRSYYVSLEALRAGICWDFESVPEYLDQLERGGTTPNVACFVGHSALRSYVMGDAAIERAATEAEIAEMRVITSYSIHYTKLYERARASLRAHRARRRP